MPSTLLKDARRREVKPFKDEKLWGGWVLQPLQEQYTVEKMDILQLLSSDEHQPEIFWSFLAIYPTENRRSWKIIEETLIRESFL